jgi:acetyl-CoA carboxylase carboxyl transferase subunit alpha
MERQTLDFEEPIFELEKRISEFEKMALESDMDLSDEINILKSKLDHKLDEVFSDLTSWQKVKLARHAARPITSDYLQLIFEDLIELHGDRAFGDDQAIVTYLARLDERKFLLVANKKGADTHDRVLCNFGMPHPEGYRKALEKMKLAEKFNLPIIILINTPGAYPGIGAEERGQAHAIAKNLREMASLRVPIITCIISEGFSGGALGIGVGDRNLIFEYGIFSVISPEGCAAILWRDGSKAPEASEVLKLTADELYGFGIMDRIIEEPRGGAHRDKQKMAEMLKKVLIEEYDVLVEKPLEILLDERYLKYRRIGEFFEGDFLFKKGRRMENAD